MFLGAAEHLRRKFHYWLQGRVQHYTRYMACNKGICFRRVLAGGLLRRSLTAAVRCGRRGIDKWRYSEMRSGITAICRRPTIVEHDTGLERS